ncbi:MAG: cyclic beta 1-2 glucan synthetase, partial [Proteobacteria bacterium]|nr:cyclic beta 1-2 glucan synthetase [Pseudomonadota bacterium]
MRSTCPGRAARERNPISRLSQWKIVDNLRRSLLPVALVTLLGLGWLQGAAWFATLAVIVLALAPRVIATLGALARRSSEQPWLVHVREVVGGLVLQLARDAFGLACLPYDAIQALDALARALVRVHITGKNLLQWRTARAVQRAHAADLRASLHEMWIGPVIVVLAIVGLPVDALVAAAPILLLWAVSPAWSWWLVQPITSRDERLAPADRTYLRTIARRTWRYFETYVTAEDNYLPPDNVQEDPPRGVAHRTSPTNIGLSLLGSLAAYDLGYLTASELLARTARTIATIDRMQRERGHLYNWYDTRTLEPLRPMYISTVDSGNLAGHLLTLAAGLEELGDRPTCPTTTGLVDALEILATLTASWPEVGRELVRARDVLRAPTRTTAEAFATLSGLAPIATTLVRIVDAHGEVEPSWWARTFAAHVAALHAELVLFAPARTGEATLAQAAALDDPEVAAVASARLDEVRRLARRCRELADLDYTLLYDRQRHLLSIGYNVADRRLDASCYDLLASEARLASFVAIAHDKLPQEHWFSLGRQLTTTRGKPALLSWSGSMFEYLMPNLVMPTYPGTLLDETCHAVVAHQIAYGRERGVPWGVSESGYAKLDVQLDYQYRAFGVPGLGFKRGLGEDLVIAPYATALALVIAPAAACANLRRLAGVAPLGACGFHEAIDYTTTRVSGDPVVIKSYMAHHQGMTLLAIVYAVLDRPMQRRFTAAPSFHATELLLQERIRRGGAVFPHPAEASAMSPSTSDDGELRVFTTPNTAAPEVQLLSNGRYHVAITNAGGGYSRWRDLAVTRWHEDATRDAWGAFGYVRDVSTGTCWSVAHQPTLVRGTGYEAIFSSGRAEFRRRDHGIETHVEISISPEDDVELRRVSFTNRSKTTRTIELTSYAEVVIAPAAADAAHPAFSNLFVQTEILRDHHAIVCTRRPRSGAEHPPWMIHLATVQGTTAGEASFETSRVAFIGRGRSPIDPIAMYRATLTDTEGSVLDPIVAIRRVVV